MAGTLVDPPLPSDPLGAGGRVDSLSWLTWDIICYHVTLWPTQWALQRGGIIMQNHSGHERRAITVSL